VHRGARYLVQGVVFLLIGAVLTVAVAWGCVMWSPTESYRPMVPVVGRSHRVIDAISRHDRFEGFVVFEHRGVGWELDYVYGVRKGQISTPPNDLAYASAGLPWLCLDGQRRTISGAVTDWRIVSLPNLPWCNGMMHRYAPWSPRWPAFMANTVVYAGFSFALFSLMIGWRRVRRRRGGRCVRCGYDLGGLAPDHARCPECGATIRRAAAPTAPSAG